MTARELGNKLTIRELYEYIAFYQDRVSFGYPPYDGQRLDILFADLQALIANVNTDKKHRFTVHQFLRTWQEKPKRTPSQIAKYMKAGAMSLGAIHISELLKTDNGTK